MAANQQAFFSGCYSNELPSGVNVPLVDGFFNETSDNGAEQD
jgi:hypothetical protein